MSTADGKIKVEMITKNCNASFMHKEYAIWTIFDWVMADLFANFYMSLKCKGQWHCYKHWSASSQGSETDLNI